MDESFSPMMVLEQEAGYFHQHSFENGGSFGGYLYVDIIPVLGGLDIEINGLASPYNFTFYNDAMELANVEPDTFKFIFAAGNTYITIQKPIFKLGIPFLAKAKLFAGGGFNRHAAIPIINQEMMESVVLDEDGNTDLAEGEFNSDALIDYLEENMFEATGVHFQGGLQFRLLTFDLFAYYQARFSGIKMYRFPVFFGKRAHGVSKWNFSLASKYRFIKRTLAYSLDLYQKMKKHA